VELKSGSGKLLLTSFLNVDEAINAKNMLAKRRYLLFSSSLMHYLRNHPNLDL